MRLQLAAYGLLAWLAAEVSGTALHIKLLANEKSCFYAAAETSGQKMAFYFAVRAAISRRGSRHS